MSGCEARRDAVFIPINAISYFTSLERHGWYLRRPKVEIPEKMESAWFEVNCCLAAFTKKNWRTDLSSAIARECVVPETLVRTFQWFLIVVMVTMSSYSRSKAENCRGKLHCCSQFLLKQ